MKVLIADKFPESGRNNLAALGLELTFEPEAKPENLPKLVEEAEILIVRGKKVSPEAIQAGKKLKLIVRAGAGYNTIDVPTASELGIRVANCPGKNGVAVAELTLGLLVALDRRIPQANAELKAGQWNKKEYSKAAGLFGKTLGIVGVGNIGREVAVRAKAMGMTTIGYDKAPGDLGAERVADLATLAQRSDAVCIHLPANAETKGSVGKEFFSALPKGAMVVNTSRGGIVDEAALLVAMDERDIRYASDVFANEPGSPTSSFEDPVVKHPNSVCTPHIGASTTQAQQAVSDEVVRIVESYKTSGNVPNCVNLDSLKKA